MSSLDQSYGYIFRKLLEAPVVVGYSTGADECYFHCINKLIDCYFRKKYSCDEKIRTEAVRIRKGLYRKSEILT